MTISRGRYRSEVAGALPGDLPSAVVDAIRDTLGAAAAVAQTMGEVGAVVLEVARAAFTQGMRVTALLTAVVALAAAVLALVTLRGVAPLNRLRPPFGSEDRHQESRTTRQNG